MRNFRVAVGASLKGKVEEHGFFLKNILEVTHLIANKHWTQDRPINVEMDQLNYFFSAYLNTIQSLKDACRTAMDVDISWADLSPTYGCFIFYCRNAVTHDGCQLVNSGKGLYNYITGPLRRLDGHGRVTNFNPPKEDVLALCLNISTEILTSIGDLLRKEGQNIPVATGTDFESDLDFALKGDFIPDEIKKMVKGNRAAIVASLHKVEAVAVVPQILSSVEAVQKFVADNRIIRP